MNTIEDMYNVLSKDVHSDIFEHLPTLSNYAYQSTSAIELGVRGANSTWAILHGLLKKKMENAESPKPKFYMVDINQCNVDFLIETCKDLPIELKTFWKNDLDINLSTDLNDETYDMLFIDTWHVYGHLKRELELYSKIINKYIIMHDTTVDEIHGETLRSGWNAEEQSRSTGIPVEEITKGLSYAIDEFLQNHPEWVLKEKYTNNNGLTVLERV